VLIRVRLVRTSPRRRGLARGLPKVLAQMRLVGEAAPQRNVAQGRIGVKHALSGQFHAPSHDERVGWFTKSALEGSREMRCAALNQRAEIRDEDRPGDMNINIVTHLARLPGQQALPSVGDLFRGWWMNLAPQQRGCFEQSSLGWVFLAVKLTHGCFKERNQAVHPFARSHRAQGRYRQRLLEVMIHSVIGSPSSGIAATSDAAVTDLHSCIGTHSPCKVWCNAVRRT